ncbi:hypothetical protein Q7P37_005646 [Cladosporium fusiforme]
MPRKQAVYGKRSQATCTNIFASPGTSKTKTKSKPLESLPAEKHEQSKKCINVDYEQEEAVSPVRHRKALGEINGNAVLNVESAEDKSVKSGKSKSKSKKSTKARTPKTTAPMDEVEAQDTVEAKALQKRDDNPSETNAPSQSTKDSACEIKEPVTVDTEEHEVPEIQPEAQRKTPKTPKYQGPISNDNAAPTPVNCFTEHCSSLLELTSYPISSFSDWADGLCDDFTLVKIAEASFGEVYRLSLQPEVADDPELPLTKNDESVLKVIALKQPAETLPKSKRDRERALEKAEAMSNPADVASELKLLQRLSDIPGFTHFRDLRVLQGRPPGPFAEAFKAFNTAQKAAKKELSIFPDPAKKSSYSKDQLWAVIEMQDAGTDLEKLVAQGVSSNIWVVWDIFWQVVLALAKGEEEAEFEHRDLHLGNICVRTPDPVIEADIDISKTFGFTSFEATLIDYTVSRASMIPASATCDLPEKDCTMEQVAYIDLANDPHLFYGDSAEEYQYDIYRYMRGSIYYSSPYASFPNDGTSATDEDQEPEAPSPPSAEEMAAIERDTGRSWRQFHPQTNLCWLHYVLYMLLEQMYWPSTTKAPNKKYKREEHARYKRARELENALLKVQEMLDPGFIGEEGSMGRSGEIVAWAVEEGWLKIEDVVGDGGEFEEFGEEGEDDELARQLEELALQPSQGDTENPKESKGGKKKKTAPQSG